MTLSRSKFLLPLGLALAVVSAQAQVGTGTLAGWTSVGDVATQAGSLWLSTAYVDGVADEPGNLSGVSAVDITAVESAAGLAPYSLDLAPDDYGTEGSLAAQSFGVAAGQLLRFEWSFGSAETSFADHAFVVLNGQVLTLATRSQPGAASQVFSQPLGPAGLVSIAFGVIDTQDVTGVSTLRISDLQVSAVPEPASAALLLAGVAGLAGLLRRRRRR